MVEKSTDNVPKSQEQKEKQEWKQSILQAHSEKNQK